MRARSGTGIKAALTALMVAVLLIAGCGGDDGDGTSTRIETRPAPDPSSGYPIKLTYEPDSPYGNEITPGELDEGVQTLERRAKLLGLDGTKVRSDSKGRIVVTYAPEDFSKQASSQLPVQGRLFFYDFSADVIGNPDQPIKEVYDAVTQAAKQKAVDSDDNTTGKQYYLFGGLRNYRAGPVGTRSDLFVKFAGRQPTNTEVKVVQPGTVVVLAQPLSNALEASQFEGNFILRDRPQLDNSDITGPKFAESDGKPTILFQFTAAGKKDLQRMTKQMAEEAEPGTDSEFAVVIDNQILSRAPVDPQEFSDGLDGEDGASVGGQITEEQAKSLAAVLQSGPLPFRMIPVLQEQVQ